MGRTAIIHKIDSIPSKNGITRIIKSINLSKQIIYAGNIMQFAKKSKITLRRVVKNGDKKVD